MNGTAWVVEINRGGQSWFVETGHQSRKRARDRARNLKAAHYTTRVRKYLRQPETRP